MEVGVQYRWGGMVPGREAEALKLFGVVTQFMNEAKAKGYITYFEPFLLSTGDYEMETGFFIIKGAEEGLVRLYKDDEYMKLILKSSTLLKHFHVEQLMTMEGGIPKAMQLSESAIKQLQPVAAI